MLELTLLKYHMYYLCAIVDRSSKHNSELSSEGIEFSCTLDKLFCRGESIALRRSKENFRALVRRRASRTEVVTMSQVR